MPRGCPEKPQALPRCSLGKTYVTTLSFPQMLRLPLPPPQRLGGALAGKRKNKTRKCVRVCVCVCVCVVCVCLSEGACCVAGEGVQVGGRGEEGGE